MQEATRILVCPLNWGMGHASRCIPIIHKLLENSKEVIIASDGYPQALLKDEFSQVTHIDFPSYKIHYSKGKSQIGAILKSMPEIIGGIIKEHHELKKLISRYRIDCVLSDNRFGLWNKQIHSVYMTHQLMIKMPCGLQFIETLVWRMHRWFIHRYDLCLIPDKDADGGFTGDLTHKYRLPKNARFIDIQSRFSPKKKQIPRYHMAAILSGVEPQRSLLEKILIKEWSQKDMPCIIVQGLPSNKSTNQQINKLHIASHLNSKELEQLLIDTPTLICRSGYSTIMDLIRLNRTAILVPTPGQTEQEYLAHYLSEKKYFTNIRQEKLSEYLKAR